MVSYLSENNKNNNFRKNRFNNKRNDHHGKWMSNNKNKGNIREHSFNERNDDARRARFMRKARGDVITAYKATALDHSIIEAIKAYNELEKVRNIVYERLEEWYSAYFPNVKMGNHETYARIITSVKNKEIDETVLKGIVGDDISHITNGINSSQGFSEIDEEEYKTLKKLAEEELSIIKLQEILEKFLEVQTKKLIPNIVYLIDYKIAAEMLSMAGSIEHLAVMPASTIQLLGAEKALFKHMKFGSRPPKYGYLFKLPELANMDKKEKGRMARVYATKISIAARADFYTKRFIADTLKEQINSIMKRKPHTQKNNHNEDTFSQD